MSCTHDEIVSQPDLWRRVAELSTDPLPADGEHIAVVGCGTSWFIAQAYTVYRERAGKGAGDAYTATEFPWGRAFDRVICLSRSGTTTEIIQVMKRLHEEGRPALLITAVAGGPASEYASEEVVLDFADETSVVQTRFATSALQYFLGSLGHDVEASAADAERALATEIPSRWVDADQISFLGTGWTIGLAAEAGLKLREASQSWTEVYPAMEYRHGPISIAQPGRVVAMGDLMVYGALADRSGQSDGAVMEDWFSFDNWPPETQTGLNPVIDVEDLSMLLARQENGVMISYEQCHFTPDYWRNYTVIGTRGRAENFGDGEGGCVRVWAHRSGYEPVPDLEIPLRGDAGGHGDADVNTMDEFVRFVVNGDVTDTTPLGAREAVAAGVAATASLRGGNAPVDVPRVRPEIAEYFNRNQLR